jgi:Tol biopolymer transport system component
MILFTYEIRDPVWSPDGTQIAFLAFELNYNPIPYRYHMYRIVIFDQRHWSSTFTSCIVITCIG